MAEWCLVGNVGAELFGGRDTVGTRHFTAGTKVWCRPAQWGDGYERTRAVGRHRGSPQLVRMVMPLDRLVNFRAELCYRPAVLDRLGPLGWTESTAEACAASLRRWYPDDPDVQDAGARVGRAAQLVSADPTAAALSLAAAAALPPRPMSVALWCLEERRRIGLDQAGLAERAGIGVDAVRRLEGGERTGPSGAALTAVEAVLGRSTAAFDPLWVTDRAPSEAEVVLGDWLEERDAGLERWRLARFVVRRARASP